MSEEKKKRGRPKKIIAATEPAVFDSPKMDPYVMDEPGQFVVPEPLTEEKAKTQLTGTTEHPAYDPFKNPFFKAKMGISDKKG